MIETREDLKKWLSYDPDTGWFTFVRVGNVRDWSPKKVGDRAGSSDGRNYRKIRVGGHQYWAHRLAWLWVHGELPPNGVAVDHINGNRDDNRISNLRLATSSQQMCNTRIRSDNTSGVKGVSRHFRGKWAAEIKMNGKKKFLGLFDDLQSAARVRKAAEERYHGEFARRAR